MFGDGKTVRGVISARPVRIGQFFLLLTGTSLALAPGAQADVAITFSGDTTGQPVFQRTVSGGGSLSLTGTAVPHVDLAFQAAGTGNLTLLWNSEFDNHGAMYDGAFDPANALTNLRESNDDGGIFPNARIQQGVTDGGDYTVVTTGFANTDAGEFTLKFSSTDGVDGIIVTADLVGFTGTTTISTGFLQVGNGGATGSMADSDMVVGADGALGGSGTVGAATLEAGGVLGLSGFKDTLKVDGALTFETGSTYQVAINDLLQSDSVAVSGPVTLAGGTVELVVAPGTYSYGMSWTILTSETAITDEFAGLTGGAQFSPFIGLVLDYDDPYAVRIGVGRNDVAFSDVARTANQRAVAAALETVDPTSDVYDAVVTSPTEAAAAALFDLLSGEAHASVKSMLLDDSRFLRNSVLDRLAAEGAPGAWMKSFGSWGKADSDGSNIAGLSRDIGGAFIGADGAADNLRYGAAAGYSRADMKVDDRDSSAGVDSWQISAYGSAQFGDLSLRAGGAYGFHQIDMTRKVPDRLESDYDAHTIQLFAEAAYELRPAANIRFEPFASLTWVDIETDGFRENGSDAALRAGSSSTDRAFSTLGARGVATFDIVSLEAKLGWQHLFGSRAVEADLAFATGADFTVSGMPLARDALLVEAGLNLALTESVSLGVSYSGQIAADVEDHGLHGKIGVAF